ncbi:MULTISPECIES: substrate-binding domain-containing protein [unclassified Devosia]|uniref:substrate-binding domain-containing protein n=1 Tax=unclassified Devosia TaxID=196773 RepID=UPI00145F5266|nr:MULTISPECIES: substrate-binding domain-containing protein [unclassified Devosia]MBJ6988046.1 substrate-binding domain-containing protein [Devosia sp. MC521]MBJ7578251.1 substrate-binding domain-containing protein [Devosia sp. MC532]MBK1794780.1 substrate-binding domain-containing protein [Devosia sp. WQ 349K1]QMW62117.1 substrate-binding domain-containing protein [Devosia sp. MC521]
MSRTKLAVSGLALTLAVLSSSAAFAASKVAIVTPYMAQPGTQFYVEAFQDYAEGQDWDVNVIDTAGDVAAVISRIEDLVIQGVDAIVINVDPAQVTAGLQTAKDAGIPVFGMDAGADSLLVTNVTSNGYAMAAETSTYVADRIGGEGNVVMFIFEAFPPVQVRGVVADAVFGNFPDIKVIDRVTPDVSDGGIADSRAKMEAILAANPEPGSIKAVWAAWDQPALGVLQAIEAAGREGEGIIITGIDANPQAKEAIAAGGNFEASVAQDFAGIGAATADAVARVLAGEDIRQSAIYVPTKLVTSANAAE